MRGEEGERAWKKMGSVIQAVAVGGGPVGEEAGELGDAAVGALVPNPCSSNQSTPREREPISQPTNQSSHGWKQSR
jgi:hypothetical protein